MVVSLVWTQWRPGFPVELVSRLSPGRTSFGVLIDLQAWASAPDASVGGRWFGLVGLAFPVSPGTAVDLVWLGIALSCRDLASFVVGDVREIYYRS